MADKDKWIASEREEGASEAKKQRTAIGWERELVEKLATASLKEQRRARRWSIFFKLLVFAYLITLLLLYLPDTWTDKGLASAKKHTAMVKITGIIADDAEANAESIVEGLGKAFEDKKTKGVLLQINSPGGSPVQAGEIYDEIRRLREKYPDTPVYAVITDIGASGSYYIAAAADEIYADKASIVGSIGVRMDSFGFVNALDKLGVERRLLTAGDKKGFLDPFLPVKDDELQHAQSLLDSIHGQFIDVVKQGRGERLKEREDLFSGLVWTGEQALEYGLIDGIGSPSYVARELIGAKKIVDYTREKDLIERFADRIGAVTARALVRSTGIESSRLQ